MSDDQLSRSGTVSPSYRNLKVWQEAMLLAENCYLVTRDFPREETFGMTSQIRRSAASIPANIAEGYGRNSPGDYVHFLRIAQGSLRELETHLMLSQRVGLLELEKVNDMLKHADQIGGMLYSLSRSIRNA